jgi:hypothetical protein
LELKTRVLIGATAQAALPTIQSLNPRIRRRTYWNQSVSQLPVPRMKRRVKDVWEHSAKEASDGTAESLLKALDLIDL